MAALLQLIVSFFSPLVIVAISLIVIIAFLLGALADPQGLMNQTVCSAIDYIASIFPSTPSNLKIGAIIDSAGSKIPVVGKGIISDVFTTVLSISAIALIIKIYKLLPFKFS